MKRNLIYSIAAVTLVALMFASCSQETRPQFAGRYHPKIQNMQTAPNSYYVKVKSHSKNESKTVAIAQPAKQSRDVIASVPGRPVNYVTAFSSTDNVAYPLNAPIALNEKSKSANYPDLAVNGFSSGIKLPSGLNSFYTPFPSIRTSAQKQSAAPPSGGGKSQLVALLLCIFFGGLGIHRFYLGYIGIGIIQLLTAGGCGIWALIDLVRIITGDLKPKGGDYSSKL